MVRPKIKNRDLPSRMVRRIYKKKSGEVVDYFYYEHPMDALGKRKLTKLGTDLLKAKMMWAELERASHTTAKVTADESSVAALQARHLEWSQDRKQSGLSLRTLRDREAYWKKLGPAFGEIHVDAFKPEYIVRYFDKRSAKSSAKKELKYLSVMFNWGRARGFVRIPNPATGVLQQLKVKGGRDNYVTDEMMDLVYSCSVPVIQDCIDLAYLTGQRPADVRKMRWDQVKDGAVWVEQGKGGKKLQIAVEGDLAMLLDRIKSRGVIGMTLLCDPKGQQLKEFGYFRSQFKLARDRAAAKAAELGIKFERFQFKDLRAKSASDIGSMSKARMLLGHSTESMTRKYVRTRVGERVSPISKSGNDTRKKE